jgi:hypothetical protein
MHPASLPGCTVSIIGCGYLDAGIRASLGERAP